MGDVPLDPAFTLIGGRSCNDTATLGNDATICCHVKCGVSAGKGKKNDYTRRLATFSATTTTTRGILHFVDRASCNDSW
jgi:hypothetical protein